MHDLDVTNTSATFLPLLCTGREDSVRKTETAGYPVTTCHLKGGPPPRGSFAFSAKVKLAGVFQGLQQTMHVSISEAYPQGTDVNKPLC